MEEPYRSLVLFGGIALIVVIALIVLHNHGIL